MPHLPVEIAIEPKSKAGQEKLRAALARLAGEDSSFAWSFDDESGQMILKGVSELVLDAKLDLLRRTYKIDANVGAPQVAFRERPTKHVEHDEVHKKQSGGSGQFAAVTIMVEPTEPDTGYQFKSGIVGGAVPRKYIPAVEKGIESVLISGVAPASRWWMSR
jgi:elongation factor G